MLSQLCFIYWLSWPAKIQFFLIFCHFFTDVLCVGLKFCVPHTELSKWPDVGHIFFMTTGANMVKKTFLEKKTFQWRQWALVVISSSTLTTGESGSYQLLLFRRWAIRWIAHYPIYLDIFIFNLFSKMLVIWSYFGYLVIQPAGH